MGFGLGFNDFLKEKRVLDGMRGFKGRLREVHGV